MEEDRAAGEHGEGAPTAGDGVGKARGVFEQEVTCRTVDVTWREGRRKGHRLKKVCTGEAGKPARAGGFWRREIT